MRTAARLFQQSCYRYREELSAGIIVAGWDPRRGGQVRSLHSRCPLFLPCSIPLSALACPFFHPGVFSFLLRSVPPPVP